MTKRKPSPARILTSVCAAFSAVCFLSYLLSVVTHAGTVFSYALPIVACTVVILPPLTEHFWAKVIPSSVFRVGKILYSAGVLFFTVTFCVMLCMLASFSHNTVTVEDDTVVLVYGCRVNGEEPGDMLRERLDLALSLLSENENSRVIVSGGLDEGETVTEGDVMARYLMENGISADRIVIDAEAESTKGNIRAFLSLTEAHNLPQTHLISVSSSFHMPRIAYLSKRFGLSADGIGAKTERISQWFPAVVREYMAYVKMLLLNDYT